ncbi:hypothetical protein HOA91_02090 [Candidatus Woesearchaeota archaeon]|jgi:hypothetical protein|nr:hypothetical protein [Candidatus Woesearchaeota archaeon]
MKKDFERYRKMGYDQFREEHRYMSDKEAFQKYSGIQIAGRMLDQMRDGKDIFEGLEKKVDELQKDRPKEEK